MPPIELGVIGFAVFMLFLLVVVRAKRSRDQKRRRAASSGFYDFDLAHYGTAGGSLMEKAVESANRPLAPTFVSSARGSGSPTPVGGAPVPVPSSFGVMDRTPAGPLPTFDQDTARKQRPPVDGAFQPPAGSAHPGLPLPSSPVIPPPAAPPVDGAGTGSSLPPLVQPPPPSPPAADSPT